MKKLAGNGRGEKSSEEGLGVMPAAISDVPRFDHVLF